MIDRNSHLILSSVCHRTPHNIVQSTQIKLSFCVGVEGVGGMGGWGDGVGWVWVGLGGGPDRHELSQTCCIVEIYHSGPEPSQSL